MKDNSRGSAAVILLVTGLIILFITQLFVLYTAREYEKQAAYLHSSQLRLLARSWMTALSGKEVPPGEKIWLQTVLYPGRVTAQVSSNTACSRDETVKYLEISAKSPSEEHKIRQVSFVLNDSYRDMAQKYAVISGKNITGTEFLPDGVLYTSNKEVSLPAPYDLSPWSINELPAEILRQEGLGRRFYYIDDYNGFTFAAGMEVCGSGLIAADGKITVGSGCRIAGPLILIAAGKITVQDDCCLDNVLLLSKKSIVIGRDCRINGVMISEGDIEFMSDVDFTHDEKMVALFSSVYYII